MEKYYRNQNIIDGELDNHQVMMHLEKGKYFGLNPIGKRIWELLVAPHSFQEIIDVLLAEYNVSTDVCIKEVKAFMEKATQWGVIEKSEVPL